MVEQSDDDIRHHAAKMHNAKIRRAMDICAKLCVMAFAAAVLAPILGTTGVRWWACAILTIVSAGFFVLAHFLVRFICSEA